MCIGSLKGSLNDFERKAENMSNFEMGAEIARSLNPGLMDALAQRYDKAVPGMSEGLIAWAYGMQYGRGVVDMKTRQLCTIAALTAMGGQNAPQLKANIVHTLATGAEPAEILEVIWQMAVYGGMPSAINGLNAAIELFEEQGVEYERDGG